MEALVTNNNASRNPLRELIDDNTFNLLREQNLLSPKGVRNYCIRRRFRQMRAQHIPAIEAIERLRREHPYLKFDTIRKIVYCITL